MDKSCVLKLRSATSTKMKSHTTTISMSVEISQKHLKVTCCPTKTVEIHMKLYKHARRQSPETSERPPASIKTSRRSSRPKGSIKDVMSQRYIEFPHPVLISHPYYHLLFLYLEAAWLKRERCLGRPSVSPTSAIFNRSTIQRTFHSAANLFQRKKFAVQNDHHDKPWTSKSKRVQTFYIVLATSSNRVSHTCQALRLRTCKLSFKRFVIRVRFTGSTINNKNQKVRCFRSLIEILPETLFWELA